VIQSSVADQSARVESGLSLPGVLTAATREPARTVFRHPAAAMVAETSASTNQAGLNVNPGRQAVVPGDVPPNRSYREHRHSRQLVQYSALPTETPQHDTIPPISTLKDQWTTNL